MNVDYASSLDAEVFMDLVLRTHVVDGRFTGWSVGDGDAGPEWTGVTPAVGRFTNCYFDFDGTSLHILNDWIYNDAQPVSASCFNQFDA